MKRRLFIALTLPECVGNSLGRLQSALRQELRGLSIAWTRVEGIHLTLKFLGDVDESRTSEIGKRMAEIAQASRRLHLAIGAIGVFPGVTRPRVLWCGIDGELERVCELQAELQGALEEMGFPRESRPFQPHLTLGRFRDQTGLNARSRRMLKQILEHRIEPDVEYFTAGSLSLIESELHRTGAIHTPRMTGILQP